MLSSVNIYPHQDTVIAVCHDCDGFTRIVAPDLKDRGEFQELLQMAREFKTSHGACYVNPDNSQTGQERSSQCS